MKIGKATIQTQKITRHTKNEFEATYKEKHIYISTDHGFGPAEDENQKRFEIEVFDIMSGAYDVCTIKDFNTIEDALLYALEVAKLV